MNKIYGEAVRFISIHQNDALLFLRSSGQIPILRAGRHGSKEPVSEEGY
jgi:hypothetical protein